MYNLYNFEAKFKEVLFSENKSSITLRSYLSDFRHFKGWVITYHKYTELEQILESHILISYKKYLENSYIPSKTINRRLSSLRKVCEIARLLNCIKGFPEKDIHNITSHISNSNKDTDLISEFKAYLSDQSISNVEVNDHIATISDFVRKLSAN